MHDTPTVNRRPGRGWSILQFSVTRLLLGFAVLIGVRVLLDVIAKAAGVKPHTVSALMLALLIVIATLATYYGFVRLTEQRRVVELAPQGAARNLCGGLVFGSLLFASVMLLLMWMGLAHVSVGMGLTALPAALAAALVAGVWEEALLRGVLFRIVEERLGSWIALAMSAAVFGGLHAFNRGATVTSCVAIALEAGVLLGAVYMYSRRLWLPIGLHAGWNFSEGGIFGASVSGSALQPGLLVSRFQGPDTLTGGQFGPEASVVSVVACLSFALVFMALAVRAGRVAAPWWRAGALAPGLAG